MHWQNKSLRLLVKEAEGLGFSAEVRHGGHICFKKDGCQTVFASGSPSDVRAYRNVRHELRRRMHGEGQPTQD